MIFEMTVLAISLEGETPSRRWRHCTDIVHE